MCPPQVTHLIEVDTLNLSFRPNLFPMSVAMTSQVAMSGVGMVAMASSALFWHVASVAGELPVAACYGCSLKMGLFWRALKPGPPKPRCLALHYKPVGKKSNRRPRAATKSLRKRDEGPCVWLAYREERYLFSTHIVAPYFLTFVRRVHSQTFKGGIDAPRFLVSEWVNSL